MIRRVVNRMLRAPWPQRWLIDVVALAMAIVILPRIGERINVQSASGFALVLVTSTALLLAASWAVMAPAAERNGKR